MIDNVGNYGADGIVGPHHEKEGSYYTVKQVWSPVQIFMPDNFNGTLNVENRYNFLSLDKCKFDYSYVKYDGENTKTVKNGTVNGVDIAPDSKGTVNIPAAPEEADALSIKVTDQYGEELFTWVFKLKNSENIYKGNAAGSRPTFSNNTVKAGNVTYTFSSTDGTLASVTTGKGEYKFNGGPKFFAYRRSDRSFDQFYNHDDKDAEKKKTQYTEFEDLGKLVSLDAKEDGNRDFSFYRKSL